MIYGLREWSWSRVKHSLYKWLGAKDLLLIKWRFRNGVLKVHKQAPGLSSCISKSRDYPALLLFT